MSLIASPSRGIQSAHSTSLGASSEQDLTNHQTQENFRSYVSRRIAAHCQRFPTLTLGDIARKIAVPGEMAAEEADAKRKEEIEMARVSLEEILLLVRKLREGVMASHRMDGATIEGKCKGNRRGIAALHTRHRTDAPSFVHFPHSLPAVAVPLCAHTQFRTALVHHQSSRTRLIPQHPLQIVHHLHLARKRIRRLHQHY
jgi:hypothetical protein